MAPSCKADLSTTIHPASAWVSSSWDKLWIPHDHDKVITKDDE